MTANVNGSCSVHDDIFRSGVAFLLEKAAEVSEAAGVSRVLHVRQLIKMKGFLSFLKAAGQTLWEQTGWDATRKYLFSVIFVSVVAFKILHIYTHTYYLTLNRFLVWGSTFFLQDVLFLLIARAFAGSFQRRPLRVMGGVAVIFLSLYLSLLASATISFYAVMGRDFHWGPGIGFFGDMINAISLVIGIFSVIFFEVVVLVGSYFATPYAYEVTGGFTKIWSFSVPALLRYVLRRKKQQALPDPDVYEQIALDDQEDDKSDNEFELPRESPQPRGNPRDDPPGSLMKRIVVISASLIVILLSCVRSYDLGYRILSRTLAAVPFTARAHPVFEGIEYLPGDYSWLEGHTALDTTPVLDWLPPDEPLPGFKDWYSLPLNKRNQQTPRNYIPIHYNPAKDPLHIPNLHNDILEPLREALSSGDVKVKHIVLVKLESNRQDVFPLHADSYIMQRVRESYGGKIPKEIEDRLSHLTPNAEHFTGFDNGFGKNDQDRPKPRGGLSAKNAYTSGTFTLKSITGSHCGLNPLAVDKNREWLYNIYQPCLPHILEAMNRQLNITSETDDWTAWPWHTMWMQSVSDYDNLTQLMPVLGFQDQINQETIDEIGGEYAPDKSQIVPDRGYMDKVLKNYLRDVVAYAERNHTRLFLSHLTGASHLPWDLPGHQSEDLVANKGRTLNEHLNRYLNTLVYQDQWLTEILNILQEAGVADDTLFVMVGDQ